MSKIMTIDSSAEGLSTRKMPGHWVLARLGKTVLRPGGTELTRRMLDALGIGAEDDVVEFAPGLGLTARLTVERRPASYTAVERDVSAAEIVRSYLKGARQLCVTGSADQTGLPDASASVIYGEAMLTMQTPEMKRRIVGEAHRLLRSGGRYGIHELCLVGDDLADTGKEEINQALSRAIHVGARPLSVSEWRSLMEREGFEVHAEVRAPMHLLEPRRLLIDEGLKGALRFVWNIAQDPEARERVFTMRKVFRRYQANLAAVTLICVKRQRTLPVSILNRKEKGLPVEINWL